MMSFLNKKNLQQIIGDSETIVIQHVERLNKVSADIKSLIKKLVDVQIPFTYIYVLSADCIWSEEKNNGDTISIYHVKCLTWGKDAKGKFQLRYNAYETPINFFSGKLDHVLSKPIFELKAIARIELESELPDFYQSLINILRNNDYLGMQIAFSSKVNIGSRHDSRLLELKKTMFFCPVPPTYK